MSYTVSEAAEELNISKVTIYKKVKQLNRELKPYLSTKKGIKYIDTEGLELIKNSISGFNLTADGVKEKINTSLNNVPETIANDEVLTELKELKKLKDELVNQLKSENEFLKSELHQKNDLINNQVKIIENSQVLLKEHQEKVLLLEDNQKNEDFKGFWKRFFNNN